MKEWLAAKVAWYLKPAALVPQGAALGLLNGGRLGEPKQYLHP